MKLDLNCEELNAWMVNPVGTAPLINGMNKAFDLLAYYLECNMWVVSINGRNNTMLDDDLIDLLEDPVVAKFIKTVQDPPTTVNVKFTLDKQLLRDWLDHKHDSLEPPVVFRFGSLVLDDLPLSTLPDDPLIKQCLEMVRMVENFEEIITLMTINTFECVIGKSLTLRIQAEVYAFKDGYWVLNDAVNVDMKKIFGYNPFIMKAVMFIENQ